MKKYLFIMLAIVSAFAVTACSSSEEDTINHQIVGAWVNSNNIETTETTFNSNGTVTEISTSKRNGAKREYIGSFNINGDKLTINWGKYRDYNSVSKEWSGYTNDNETVVITFVIKNNQLIFLSMEGEEQNSPIYHTRK